MVIAFLLPVSLKQLTDCFNLEGKFDTSDRNQLGSLFVFHKRGALMLSGKFQISAKLPFRRYDQKFADPNFKPRMRRAFRPKYPRPKR